MVEPTSPVRTVITSLRKVTKFRNLALYYNECGILAMHSDHKVEINKAKQEIKTLTKKLKDKKEEKESMELMKGRTLLKTQRGGDTVAHLFPRENNGTRPKNNLKIVFICNNCRFLIFNFTTSFLLLLI